MKSEQRFEVGSGNIFADLELPEPEIALAKAQLVRQIAARIDEQGLTQKQAATTLDLDQANLSRLVRGRLSGFSVDRLMRLLTKLDLDVDITVSPKQESSKTGRIAVWSNTKEPMAAAPKTVKKDGVHFS